MLTVKGTNKSDYIRIRLTIEEKKLIKNLAESNNMTITDYIKTCVNNEMKRGNN